MPEYDGTPDCRRRYRLFKECSSLLPQLINGDPEELQKCNRSCPSPVLRPLWQQVPDRVCLTRMACNRDAIGGCYNPNKYLCDPLSLARSLYRIPPRPPSLRQDFKT